MLRRNLHMIIDISPYAVSEIDLVYKTHVEPKHRPQITCSKDAYQVFKQAWEAEKIDLLEQSKVLLLNRSNHVLGIYNVSSGGITGTVVDKRLVFAAALKANASSIVLAHNHPSANLTPSYADTQLTEQFKEAGTLMDIAFLDHLIISRTAYYSFSDEQGISIASNVIKTLPQP